ncbi:Nup85 nucleoporin-domain-containing protein [Irpex rosettiformis]|uniref:Nup85 nucleoporin-domain-containing protein n=1 Tax=Irpex rosettiformis TaxID=378272 RepID=A0ACB8TP12_9APHY|nr:Nup85 nucleoporin-domain-containing protein [Irpex rosettiformis]
MSRNVSVRLNPPLFKEGGVDDFQTSGRTLSLVVSPRDGSLAIYPTPNTDPRNLKPGYPKSQPLYTAVEQRPPTSERRTFVIDCSVVFAALQNLLNVAPTKEPELLGDNQIPQIIRKLTVDYGNFCKECWAFSSRSESREGPLDSEPDHYRKLHTCFSLFTVLYLPESGFEDAPIGDELMEWLNANYIEPSTEEGDHLSALERPWEDENFWSYVTRATLRGLSKASAFFLEALSKHPSENLRRMSEHLAPLLKNHPRLHQFNSERDFAISSRRWKEKVKTLRLELDHIPDGDRDDGFDDWWDHFSDIVSILEGREEVLKRLCVDFGSDWKEVCVAWGIFVDPRLRRQDLPEVVVQILDEMPPDPTDLEDVTHSLLMLGKPTQVLSQAAQLDPWLAAHLADTMEPLELIDRDPDDSGLTLRQQYILSYAEYLHSDPGLWRITADYMCSCGDIGKEMADQVLMRVPLRLKLSSPPGGPPNDEASRIRAGDLVGVLKEINETCHHHQRERARRAVCRIAARTFLAEKEYGLAVAYTSSAEDWPGLGRIVNCVLDEYFEEGPVKFARLVSKIEPSLQTLRKQPSSIANGVFTYRLMFAIHFADFHKQRSHGHLQEAARVAAAMLKDEIAPKSWWAVVLSDSVDLLLNSEVMPFTPTDVSVLLHKLQEITMRTSHGAGPDYLSMLARATKGKDEKSALQRLQVVRLALAKYYARCTAIGVSGGPDGLFGY